MLTLNQNELADTKSKILQKRRKTLLNILNHLPIRYIERLNDESKKRVIGPSIDRYLLQIDGICS